MYLERKTKKRKKNKTKKPSKNKTKKTQEKNQKETKSRGLLRTPIFCCVFEAKVPLSLGAPHLNCRIHYLKKQRMNTMPGKG